MRARSIFAKNAATVPFVEHVFMVDDRGRVWERFSDQAPGKWTEIPLPKMTYNKSRSSRKK